MNELIDLVDVERADVAELQRHLSHRTGNVVVVTDGSREVARRRLPTVSTSQTLRES